VPLHGFPKVGFLSLKKKEFAFFEGAEPGVTHGSPEVELLHIGSAHVVAVPVEIGISDE